LPGIDHGIGRLEKARVPDMLGTTVDPAVTKLPQVQRSIQLVAAYVGFGHAEVLSRIKRLDVVLERWHAAHLEQLAKLASAPPPGSVVRVSPQLRVKALDYSCDPTALEPYRGQVPLSPCIVRLESDYDSIPARPGYVRRLRAKVVTSAGRQFRARPLAWVRGGAVEEPQALVRHAGPVVTVLTTNADLTTMLDADRPLLLWVEQGGSTKVLRLE